MSILTNKAISQSVVALLDEVLHYSIWSVVVFAILSHCFCNTYPEFARSMNIFYNFCKNHFFKNESHQRYAKKCCANFFWSADGTPKHGLKGNGRGHSFHKNYINLSKKFIILDFCFVYPNLVGGGGQIDPQPCFCSITQKVAPRTYHQTST